MPAGNDISPYDRLVWPEGELERALAGDTRRRDVIAYLGDHEYATLAPLARAAAHAHRDPERVVYLIPGIMGSQLGLRREGNEPPDLLWVDPIDLQNGRLGELAADNGAIVSLGAVPYTFLALKLRLEAAGFTVRWADYDWRYGAEDAGARLAARIAAEPARRQYLVGHSFGGLVARAAIAATDASIERLVTLGTPHHGSFAALQALRASYVSVRHIASLDPRRSAEDLTQELFARYPSLYQMLPSRSGTLDLHDAASWPDSAPYPDERLLAQAGLPQLPWPEGRSCCIAGIGFDTVAQVTVENGQFRYHVARDGDGTVPRVSAAPRDIPAWYARIMHGELPRDERVGTAVIDLLDAGHTHALTATPPPVHAETRSITDAELRLPCTAKLDWNTMTQAERRDWFAALNRPVAAGSRLEDFE